MSFRIELPLPPTANNAYPTNKLTGKRYPSPRLTQWKTHAGWLLRLSDDSEPVRGPYCFTLQLPMKARGDADGYLTAPLDLLVSAGLTPDDRQCQRVVAERNESVPAGRCVVIVEPA